MKPVSRAAGAAALAALVAGCGVVGLDLAELPTDPIAVAWWEPEDARRRAEILEQRAKDLSPTRRGVARVEAIGSLLGAPQEQGTLARYPARLSFVDPRSGSVTPVPNVPTGSIPLAWSDDHQRLLFLSNHRGPIHVYEYDVASQEVRTITAGRNPHLYADYGRGRQVAWLEVAREGRGSFDRVWVTDEAGKSPRVVFEKRNAQTLRLSPDGRTLLYVRRTPSPTGRGDARFELIALDVETGEEQPRGAGREASFSPIGDWIVYSAPSRSGWRVRRMRADGSARSPIAGGIRDEEMPSVSPDGQFVVYVGEATGLDRLFVRRMDGSGDRALSDVGAFFSPVW